MVEGDASGSMRIFLGMQEWSTQISNGHWGPWLEQQWRQLSAAFKQISDGCRKMMGRFCARAMVTRLRDHVRDDEEDSAFDTPVQTLEAWKLFKVFLLKYAPETLIGERPPPIPFKDVIASFSADGLLQSLGQLSFSPSTAEVHFPLAVTRYTMSYVVKGTAASGAQKGAGKALLSGWIESHASKIQGDLTLHTLPAGSWVRQYYIKNGAHSDCARGSESSHTDDMCAEMMEQNENCDCEVTSCVRAKCIWYFQAGMCGSLGVHSVSGVAKGCYSVLGNFVGSC